MNKRNKNDGNRKYIGRGQQGVFTSRLGSEEAYDEEKRGRVLVHGALDE